MFPHPLLIADIGGTNARFAIVEKEGGPLQMLARLKTGDYANPVEGFKAALKETDLKPKSAIGCVAGPVVDRVCNLTNANWRVSGPELQKALGFEQGLLLNDFEAQALSLPAHRPEWLKRIGDAAPAIDRATRVILGPGTGLGIGALIDSGGHYIPISSEACHIDFGPVGAEEQAFWPHLEKVQGRVTTESVMSGPGLVRIHKARWLASGKQSPAVDGVAIVNAALDNPASDERKTINAYLRIIARFAGDMAITMMATGGVTLAGGILPRIASMLDVRMFRQAFEDKAPVDALARRMSIDLLMEPDAVLYGMALIGADPTRYAISYAQRDWKA